jgi:flagellar M-ring protein FliF
MQGNLLSRALPASPDDVAGEAALDYRQKLERDLVQKINITLDPLLGHDRYRASASVDCDLSSGEQSEETLDPARSVMLQSQKSEEMMEGAAPSGVPGTPSNLPRPTSRPGSNAGALTTRRTENVTYQSSRTVRTMKIPQGGIKRLSVALLLDQSVQWEGSGKTLKRVVTPPSPETLKTVHDLVAAAVGFVQERGDQITVETLPFEETLKQKPEEPTAPAAPPRGNASPWLDWKRFSPVLIGAAALLIVLLIIGLVLLTRKPKVPPRPPEAAPNLPAGAAPANALESANLAQQIEAQMAERAAAQEQADMLALASIKVPPVKTRKAEVLAKQLRENAKKDASGSAQILQTWIHERV